MTTPFLSIVAAVEVALTPKPQAVEKPSGVDRMRGKEVVLTNVPLTRFDLANIPSPKQLAPVTHGSVAGIAEKGTFYG
jgi:hypothetical protein